MTDWAFVQVRTNSHNNKIALTGTGCMAVRLGSTVRLNKTQIYYYSKFRYKLEPITIWLCCTLWCQMITWYCCSCFALTLSFSKSSVWFKCTMLLLFWSSPTACVAAERNQNANLEEWHLTLPRGAKVSELNIFTTKTFP